MFDHNLSIPLQRFQTASSLHSAAHYMSMKRWPPQQKPFAEMVIRMLERERDAVIMLGTSELKLDPNQLVLPSPAPAAISLEEKDANNSEG